MEHDVDGFIMRDGELISIDNVERMFAVASESLDSPAKVARMMIDLAFQCNARRKFGAARAYFEKALDLAENDQQRASCLLSIGQLSEEMGDFAGAVEWYGRGLQIQPVPEGAWYLLHNNTGYCLNELGRHQEAEEFCRKAIQIDPDRHNAHKNLGVALAGLGRHAEAAVSWLAAAEKCPEDQRALRLLEDLVRSHPEIEDQVPEFPRRMSACRTTSGAGRN